MKTPVKILILVLFSIAAIAGVLVFAKTRVAPPSNLESVNQYSINLESETKSFNNINDFSEARGAYIRMDDRLLRFLYEGAIDDKVSDEFRKKIDEHYGNVLKSYSFDLLQKSVWPEDKLNEMQTLLSSLKADKLSTGENAATYDFIASAERIDSIMGDYRKALRLSRNVSFDGIDDASSKIQQAERYKTADYLKNNAALVSALDVLPSRIAQSHYDYVCKCVDALGNYRALTSDYYKKTLIPQVDKVIEEYKKTTIYGGDKLDKDKLDKLVKNAESLIKYAIDYYGD